MRLLHTSDWHVGKAIRGHSRAEEHRSVLAEIAEVAERHEVDMVVVAGDLFETAAPPPEAEAIVYDGLLALARTGAEVLVVSGNHDNARRLRALAPLLELGRVHAVATPMRPDEGGVRILSGRGGQVRVAALPFVSQRGIVRAADLMARAPFEHTQAYADRLRALLEHLCEPFADDLPNVVVAHAFVLGGATGGGERPAHLADEYQVPAQAFPPTASYVALGHLHRPQRIPGPTALHYCGSPLQLDFGEAGQAKQVNVVELEAGVPAAVTPVPLRSGRPLVSVRATLDQLADSVADVDEDAWLRIELDEDRRAGLAEEVRDRLGDRVVDVRLLRAPGQAARGARRRRERTPNELFAEYCQDQGVRDERILRLFAELHDEVAGDEGTTVP